ncbi:cbb3-type cytochrome oxidase subunit 3 [Rhodopila sp.]|jgi:cbb3-type cytochrome oxidase subunit 3|uniref:cbb3-type cytochrome oxidase subunit 3 n=1 Tax=Rhodopila sp. TaxID=2480087 RepID=UPI002B548DCE|nr:cbb3-type cytochrome c oxidase subunit 3 [Rhodopila sp.]HVZ08158.1 cbb3-type cytochrome c oxidase subunit 3 [Rhodopila sp.]
MSEYLPLIHWIDHHLMIVMMVLFVAIVVFTYWPSRKKNVERQGQIPFKDDV